MGQHFLLSIYFLIFLTSFHAQAFTMSAIASDVSTTAAKHTLYDLPISNNGARCRIIIYKKGISSNEVALVSPMDLGGLKSEQYLKINPQGKMPSMVCRESGLNLAESDTIARYLLSIYPQEPSFQPDNAKSNLICRIHDIYMAPLQAFMYKDGPYGTYGTRKDAMNEYIRQLNVIEDLMDTNSEWMCGNEPSLADACMFPTCVFIDHILPKFDVDPPLPPKLTKWFNNLKVNDSAFKKVHDEIKAEFEAWEGRGRWDKILGAGLRDTDPPTIFDKIVAGEIPATIVKEDAKILAFKDINPAAPAHVLIIPKDRNGLTRMSKATKEHQEILGHLMVAAAEIMNNEELGFGNGARIVINDGPDAGQEIMHLHVHVLGGRQLTWPPG